MNTSLPTFDHVLHAGGWSARAECAPFDPLATGHDGRREVEVTVMLGDSVLAVHQIGAAQRGRVAPLTWGFVAAGGLCAAIGGLLLVCGQPGLGGLLVLAAVGAAVFAAPRLREERKQPRFVIGPSADATLTLAHPALTASTLTLVEAQPAGYVLRFVSGMQGEVRVGADRLSLEELVARGYAQPLPAPGQFEYRLPQDARAQLALGDAHFLLRSLTPSRPIIRGFWELLPWVVLGFVGISLLAHGLVLAAVMTIPPGGKLLSLDLFNTDSRPVDTNLRPQMVREIDVRQWLEKKRAEADAGQKGLRNKGDEGKVGTPKARDRVPRKYKLAGDLSKMAPQLAKQFAETSAREAISGMFGPRRGGPIVDLLNGKEGAFGADTETALGGLIGETYGESYGVNGLGVVGTGRHGGGNIDGALVGLDRIGGAKLGKGSGGVVPGVPGGLKRHQEARITDFATGVKISAGYDKELIRRVVRQHRNEIRYCFQKELTAKPDLEGRVVIGFTIGATGQVLLANVTSSTLANPTAEQCMSQAVRRWVFPKTSGGLVVVSYPFVLRAAGK